MHEMSLCQGIVEIIRERAALDGFQRVRVVRLQVGALSHVEPEALVFGFDVVSRGTPAEGAVLDIERPPGEAFCMDCTRTMPIAVRGDGCPECGGYKLMITAGDELRVKKLEVD